jgi:tellurite resistance protein TerC
MIIDWTIPLIIVQLIFLEGILSIDNATVLGALVSTLPLKEEVPWPGALKKFGVWLRPILGQQRTAALRVGLLGAYLGQATMLLLASYIIQNPWLKLVGAAYLVRLAFDALGAHGGEGGEDDGETGPRLKVVSFWSTVLTVELMDLAFSLDNVVAAVSLSEKLWVVMVGVAIGVLTMRFAAGKFSYYIERNPVLKTAAYILVLNIGIELVLDELGILKIGDLLRFGISVSTILLALAYSRFKWMQVIRPLLFWLSEGFGILNDLLNWILAPLFGIFKLAWRTGKTILSPRQSPT